MIVSEYFEKSISNARCSSWFTRDNMKYFLWEFDIYESTILRKNRSKICNFIEIKLENISKSVAKWSWKRWESRCCSYERKRFHWKLHTLCPRSRSYHNINLKILHRRIENFLNLWTKTMYLIDKKYISLLKVWKYTNKVGLLLDCWTWTRTQVAPHLVGKNRRNCSFSKTRRPIKEYMLEWISSYLCGTYRNGKMLLQLCLSDIVL